MDRKMKRSVVRVLLLAVGLALLGGCATTGQSQESAGGGHEGGSWNRRSDEIRRW